MLRITAKPDGQTTVLKLEGQLIGPWVGELEQACAELQNSGRPARLDLSDLDYADQAGSNLLANLAAGFAEISNCSPFLRALIQSQPATDPPPPVGSTLTPVEATS